MKFEQAVFQLDRSRADDAGGEAFGFGGEEDGFAAEAQAEWLGVARFKFGADVEIFAAEVGEAILTGFHGRIFPELGFLSQ